jgi:hypothetical protein
VKKVEAIPKLDMPTEIKKKAIMLPDKALGKFIGLWPSPQEVQIWILE